jgi:hypothetical protein
MTTATVTTTAERPFVAHELARGSSFVVFVAIGDFVHVSEWFGYDITRVNVYTVAAARSYWRSLVERGYTRERDASVGPQYLGLDRSKLPR